MCLLLFASLLLSVIRVCLNGFGFALVLQFFACFMLFGFHYVVVVVVAVVVAFAVVVVLHLFVLVLVGVFCFVVIFYLWPPSENTRLRGNYFVGRGTCAGGPRCSRAHTFRREVQKPSPCSDC